MTTVAKRYDAAQKALLALDPTGQWSEVYQALDLAKDVTGPGRDPQEDVVGEGKYVQSWIWNGLLGKSFQETLTARGTPTEDPPTEPFTDPESSHQPQSSEPSTTTIKQMNEVLRVEWSRLNARADRWEEEYALLVEEMRRTIAYLQWKANDWDSKSSLRAADVPAAVQSGLAAYAAKQASCFRQLVRSFAVQWYPSLKKHDVACDWFDPTGNMRDIYYSNTAPTQGPPSPLQDFTVDAPHSTADSDEDGEQADDDDEHLDWEDGVDGKSDGSGSAEDGGSAEGDAYSDSDFN
jgi:hypothetical protein